MAIRAPDGANKLDKVLLLQDFDIWFSSMIWIKGQRKPTAYHDFRFLADLQTQISNKRLDIDRSQPCGKLRRKFCLFWPS